MFELLSWVCRPNPEDRINSKPEDQKIDQRMEKATNHKTQKLMFGSDARMNNLPLVN